MNFQVFRNVRTEEPENFDEEVKSLGTAWCLISLDGKEHRCCNKNIVSEDNEINTKEQEERPQQVKTRIRE